LGSQSNTHKLDTRSGSIQFAPLGDSALLVQFGETIDREVHNQVRQFAERLAEHPTLGRLELTTAFTTACVFYDPTCVSFADLCEQLQPLADEPNRRRTSAVRVVEIPVCYGGQYGPDLAFVAEHNGLTEEEVISLHAGGEYYIYMLGFAPGFPYLGGLPEQIATPRHATPRAQIPAGSVGIAGNQTGIYPVETPGGWQLIGRTPLVLFRPWENPPSLLLPGDTVCFRSISADEMQAWPGEQG
jgi:inhibitor of KinA